MRRLPSEIKRYEQRWHGEHDPRYAPAVVPARVLGQPEEDVDVFVGPPSGKEGLHPHAWVKMILVVPENDVMAHGYAGGFRGGGITWQRRAGCL